MVGLAVGSKDSNMGNMGNMGNLGNMGYMEHRENEKSGTYFRSHRFFKVDAQYYFSTREGIEIGPFESEEAAAEGLGRFVDSITKEGDALHAKKLALSGNWAVTMYK